MTDDRLACPECGATAETENDLEAGGSVPAVEFAEASSGPSRIRLGADQRNLWLCKQCGEVLGVN